SGVVQAAGKPLVVEPMDGVKIRIDGDLREWPNKMTELGQTLQGSAGGDPKAKAVVGYDEKNLYVVVTVTDNKLAQGDHATLHLAFPKGRDSVTYDVDLHPGIPGKSPGAVKVKGGPAAGAKLVEAPTDKGWEFEAQIPWSIFPEAQRTRVGLRASVSLSDSDGGGVKTVIGTASETSGRRMPPLMLSFEAGLQNLGGSPSREIFGNVNGEGMIEKVAIYGKYLTITGPRFRGGKEFYYGELGVDRADKVTKLDLHDFDGDGIEEIVVQKRIGSSDEYRELLEVMKVGKDDTPFATFTHEVGIKNKDGLIENKVKISGSTIEIAQGEAEGFEPDTYDLPLPGGGVESALLPWDSIGSRSYKYQGSGFQKEGEKNWEPKTKKGGGASAAKKKRASASNEPPPPPPPRPPTADELLDRVYALYRKDRGVGGGKPRFDFVTDVAGDTGPERVLIHDRDIVVFGKGFRQGQSYAFITVGVPESKDILDATARDLTGDGKAEIIVRGVLHAKASKELGGDTVDRHALFVYGIQGDKVVRIFAAETGRSLGKDRILGAVAFENDKKGLSIELRPAQAVGWTEKSYPFPPDTTTAGGLEPLLLPWGDSAKRRYRYNGSAYVLE
ncbi:MAG TPA: hypothetical protein VM686_33465, partial [Polyangiaceae bacterium]|nr:hypothetical protein [Polyangiaceae bacterium]